MYNFITDADIVKKAYDELDNYKIEYSDNIDTNYCAIYFSSHDIYFPNTEESFHKSIFMKDHYEWVNCRVKKASKHIFLRDVHKQWFLSGINRNINSAEKLLHFLKAETKGMQIITIGSSAGGYAAIRFGEWLKCERALAFSPRLNFDYLLSTEWDTNPIARQFKLDQINLLQSLNFKNSKYYLFYPINSILDQIQINDLQKLSLYPIPIDNESHLKIISFSTSHHGIPFPKVALNSVINATCEKLDLYVGKNISPLKFSAGFIGWFPTIKGSIKQIYLGCKKIVSRKLLK